MMVRDMRTFDTQSDQRNRYAQGASVPGLAPFCSGQLSRQASRPIPPKPHSTFVSSRKKVPDPLPRTLKRHKAGDSGDCNRRAFTLVELMVVIGILMLLMAIAIPAANSVLNTSRANSTLNTMKVLDSAISCYTQDRPLLKRTLEDRKGSFKRQLRYDNTLKRRYYYDDIFGWFPPSPRIYQSKVESHFSIDVNNPDNFTGPYAEEAKFERLIRAYLGNDDVAAAELWKKTVQPYDQDTYATIECLLMFMTHFSTQARQILDKLPDNAKTNIDKDLAFKDLNTNNQYDITENEPVIELFEIVDAWKKPIRYSIQEPFYDTDTGEVVAPAIWELRSAGPDGIFSNPWTDEDAAGTDDVILRSQ